LQSSNARACDSIIYSFYAFVILGIAIVRIVCFKVCKETNNKQGIRK